METFWAVFAQMWAKLNFPGKKGSAGFRYSDYLPSCQKSEKTIKPPKDNTLVQMVESVA